MTFFSLSFDALARTPDWLVILLIVVPFTIGFSIYFYNTRHAKSWKNGIFPSKLKPTEDNYLEAYLALGAKLILQDYRSSKGKTQFLNGYFNRYFKFANYNFGDSLVFSLRHPIKTTTVTDWLKKHLKNEGERSQVIYFLAGLAMVNGTLNRSELRFLQQINFEMELQTDSIPRIIAIYARYHQEKENKTKDASAPKSSKNNTYNYTILGLEIGASRLEIKKAYRNLVKIHHPDNFATGSEAQQRMASEKFIQIQHAYESILLINR